MSLCALGGGLTWTVFRIVQLCGTNLIATYFTAYVVYKIIDDTDTAFMTDINKCVLDNLA